MNENNILNKTYAMGRTPEGARRLQVQAQVLNPSTRRLFEQAGIKTGMKVLDVGSGPGDVALLLADMVGPSGSVVGVEIDPMPLGIAQARVHEAGLTNVSFLLGDLDSIQLDTQFDAIVGRLILMYLPDPAVTLRKLANHLHTGGIVAFQETDLERLAMAPAHPRNQMVEQTCTWIREAFRRAGVPLRTGLDMYTIFQQSGFPEPHMSCEGQVIAGPNMVGYEYTVAMVHSLLPLILRFGIATEEEVGIDTLAERLQTEVVSQQLAVRGVDMISAWTRISR